MRWLFGDEEAIWVSSSSAALKRRGEDKPETFVMEVADLIPLTGKAETRDAAWQVSRDASGVRTASMQPKESMGTREVRRVQA
jgi:hypothetical protein